MSLAEGTHEYEFEIPSTAFDDSGLPDHLRSTIAARFRLDYLHDLTATSEAFAGEVEDYEIFLNSDADDGLRVEDDTFIYEEDLEDQQFNVLGNDASLLGKTLPSLQSPT